MYSYSPFSYLLSIPAFLVSYTAAAPFKKTKYFISLVPNVTLSRNVENNLIFFWCSFVFSRGQRYARNLKRVKETLDEKALVIMKTTLAKRDRRHFTAINSKEKHWFQCWVVQRFSFVVYILSAETKFPNYV